jgi:cytochrome P450
LSTTRQPNIVSAEFKADPFPSLRVCVLPNPFYRTTLPDRTAVSLLTRYEDLAGLLPYERFTKNRRTALTAEQLRRLPWTPPIFRPLERNMLDLDPPDHTRLRSLVHKAFSPSLVEQIHLRIQTVADELIDGVSSRRKMDLVKDFALPLPMTIITEILGVPTKDRNKFQRWSQVVSSDSMRSAFADAFVRSQRMSRWPYKRSQVNIAVEAYLTRRSRPITQAPFPPIRSAGNCRSPTP